MGRILGIEIGYSLIKICETDFKSKNPRIYKTIKVMTPGSVVEDGILTVSDELVSVLKETLKSNHIRTKQVVFSVASTKIASREVMIPDIKENKIRDLVETNASDYFPMDVSQYRLSYTILDREELETGSKKIKLLVLATPNQLMEQYKELAQKCGLQAVAIDYNGNSIYQMVQPQCQNNVEMIIKVDERMSFLMVLKEGKIVMQRTVAYGVDEAVETLLEKNSTWSYIDALEQFRAKELLAENMEEKGFGEEGELRTEITGALEYLVRGISRVLDFYNTKRPQDTVKHILVTGIGGDFKNFTKLLGNALGINVDVFHGMESSAVTKDFSSNDRSLGTYISCIGAAMAPVWPVAEPKKSNTGVSAEKNAGADLDKISIIVLAAGAIIAVIFVAASIIFPVILEKQQENLNARITELQPAETLYEKYNYVKMLNGDADQIVALSQNSNNDLKTFIEEMEEKMPSGITVVSLTTTTEAVTMNIDVGTKADAAAIVSELRKFSSLSVVDTVGLTDSVDETGYHKINFTVNCLYAAAPESEGEAQ